MGKDDQSAARQTAKAQSEIGGKLVDFAQGQWREAAPYRQQTSQYWSNILKGGRPLETAVAPQINAVTQQYGMAKKGIGELPPGGLRDISMRNAGIAQAGQKASIYSGGINDALARLANQANLGTQSGLSGMQGGSSSYGQSGGTYMGLAQMGRENAMGMAQGIGSLVGMI
jgi:hypothetical protein